MASVLLPKDRRERYALYRNVIRQCDVSRDDRKAATQRQRQLLLTGSDTIEPARYNRIRESVQDSAADLYSQASVRFGVVLPPHYGEQWLDEQEAARDELHRLWHDTDAGLIFGTAVEWAHAWNTAIMKVFVDRGEPTVDLIADPSDIGVLRESIHDWDRQEALCHWYEMDLSAFRRLIAAVPDPDARAAFMADAQDHAAPGANSAMRTLGPAMSRVVLATASPTMNGSVNMNGRSMAQPREAEDVITLAELWIWDDEMIALCDRCHRAESDMIHDKNGPLYRHDFKSGGGWDGDYRVVTHHPASERILWDPQNPLEPGRHCFYPLTLEPTPGYIWGTSHVEQLYALQLWREGRFNQLDELLAKQADPPIIGLGVGGVAEERISRLRKAGGTFVTAQGGSMDVKPFMIPVPPDLFAEVKEIDAMFDRVAGRRNRIREGGQRSGEQVLQEAMLGGGPTLSKAMRVEDCLEGIATAMLRLQRRVSKRTLRKYDTQANREAEFLLSQMPGDFVARVSAHTSSPLFQQQILAKVAFAATHKALDKDELIELLQLPMAEILRPKARRRAKAEGEMQAEAVKLKEKEIDAKVVKALK